MDETNSEKLNVKFLDTEKDWLTLGECGQFLGVTKNTIIRWSKNEELNFPEPVRISARKTFYSTDLVRDWFKNREGEK